MDQALVILKIVIQLLPLVIEAIKAVEAAFQGSGKGPAKLAAVQSMIEGSYALALPAPKGEALPSYETVKPALDKTISGIVGALNSTGEFDK